MKVVEMNVKSFKALISALEGSFLQKSRFQRPMRVYRSKSNGGAAKAWRATAVHDERGVSSSLGDEM